MKFIGLIKTRPSVSIDGFGFKVRQAAINGAILGLRDHQHILKFVDGVLKA